jgi:hypothetical protein
VSRTASASLGDDKSTPNAVAADACWAASKTSRRVACVCDNPKTTANRSHRVKEKKIAGRISAF